MVNRPLTVEQVAERWGCSDNHVRNLIHSLAEANQHVEQLERELRRALIGLRTVRPCVEVYRDKYDYTVGTAMLSDFNALVSRLEDIT